MKSNVIHSLGLLLAASLVDQTRCLSSMNPVGQISQTIKITSKKQHKPPQMPPKMPNTSDLVDAKQDETVIAFIRSEYKSWVLQHNKTEEDSRFDIFKGNFLATLKAYETTGKYHALNKFADMTPEEYKQEPAPVDDVDTYVRSEYKTWADQYKKSSSNERYKYFKENFLMTMKMFEETGKFNALNEHGDMSREEFLRIQTKQAISGSENSNNRAPAYSMPAPPPAPSYPRPSGMTFTPVSPKSSSDLLNKGGGGSESGGSEWGGMEYGAPPPSPSMGGGNEWGAYSTPPMGGGGGGMGAMGGGGGMGMGGGDGMGMGAMGGGYMGGGMGGSMGAPSYDRPSEATFTPITPGSSSDMRGGSSTRGKSADNNWAGKEWGVPPPNYYDFAPPQGQGQTQGFPPPPAPMPMPMPSYDRPSEMTFTPVSPKSSSDVIKSNGGSSYGGNSGGDSDSWPGKEWGAPPPKPQAPSGEWGVPPPQEASGGNQWGEYKPPPMGAMGSNPTPSPQPDPYGSSYEFQRPSGMTFTPISPSSSSDVLRSKGGGGTSDPSRDTDSWPGMEYGAPPPRQSPSASSPAPYSSSASSSSSDMLNRGGNGGAPRDTWGNQQRGNNNSGGRGASPSSPSSYTSFSGSSSNRKAKGTFSYMPKTSGNGYAGDPRSGVKGDSFGDMSRGKSNPSSSNSRESSIKENDSLWDKVASAAEKIGAAAFGAKDSSSKSARPYSGNSYLNRMSSSSADNDNFGTPPGQGGSYLDGMGSSNSNFGAPPPNFGGAPPNQGGPGNSYFDGLGSGGSNFGAPPCDKRHIFNSFD